MISFYFSVLTEIGLWQRYFTLKGAIFQATGEAMRSIRADFDEMVRNLPEENMEVFGENEPHSVTLRGM